MSHIYTSVDQLIGHTPLLELTHIEKAKWVSSPIHRTLNAEKPPFLAVLIIFQVYQESDLTGEQNCLHSRVHATS